MENEQNEQNEKNESNTQTTINPITLNIENPSDPKTLRILITPNIKESINTNDKITKEENQLEMKKNLKEIEPLSPKDNENKEIMGEPISTNINNINNLEENKIEQIKMDIEEENEKIEENLDNQITENHNTLNEEYLFNLEALINENKNLSDLLKQIKIENFSFKEKLSRGDMEKMDLINQIKKQEESEANLKIKNSEILSRENFNKLKVENLKETISQFLEQEKIQINLMKNKEISIENLKLQIKNFEENLKEKDSILLQKTNEVNALLELRAVNEQKILSLFREKEENERLLYDQRIEKDLLGNDYMNNLQLKENQILFLNNQNSLRDKEIKDLKELYINQISKLEDKINDFEVTENLSKQKNEILNQKILSISSEKLLIENKLENLEEEISQKEKNIKKLNEEILMNKDIIMNRDQEISEIYKFKEKYDRYIYFEKNLDTSDFSHSSDFSDFNLTNMKILKENFTRILAIKKENEKQFENLKEINNHLTKESNNYISLKENFEILEKNFDQKNSELVQLKIQDIEQRKKLEEIEKENNLINNLNERIMKQNKALLKSEKLTRTNFNIFNSGIDLEENAYENFIYKNIEDLENINTRMNKENIRLLGQNNSMEKELENLKKTLEEKDSLIKELNSYSENLEKNLNDINQNIKGNNYINSIGLNLVNSAEKNYYENNLLNEISLKLKKNSEIIVELKAEKNSLKNKNENISKDLKINEEIINTQKEEILKQKKTKNEIFEENNLLKNESNKINSELIFLKNNLMIKENQINSLKNDNNELRRKIEENRKNNEIIQFEISNNSKESIEKLNENMNLMLDKIHLIARENEEFKAFIDILNGKKNLINIEKDKENIDVNDTNSKEIDNKDNIDKIDNVDFNNNANDIDADNSIDKLSIFNLENLNNFNNLILLLPIGDRNILFEENNNINDNNENNNFITKDLNSNIIKIKQKFSILQKMLIFADKEIQKAKDQKIQNDNLLSIISNLENHNKSIKNRLMHLEQILKNINMEKIQNFSTNIEKSLNLENNNNKSLSIQNLLNNSTKILPNDQENLYILNNNNISNICFDKNNTLNTFNPINNIETNDDNNIPKSSQAESFYTIQSLKKEIESLNVKNLELRGKNDILLNKNKNLMNLIFGSNFINDNKDFDINNLEEFNNNIKINLKTFSSKFFFEKYSEIFNEKILLEEKLNNKLEENENLTNEKNNLQKLIRSFQISNKKLENLISDMEKKSNENEQKNQKNFEKEISQLKNNNNNMAKEKQNIQNILMKLKSEKLNFENLNKSQINEIEKLKISIQNKDEEIIKTNNKIISIENDFKEKENKHKKEIENINNLNKINIQNLQQQNINSQNISNNNSNNNNNNNGQNVQNMQNTHENKIPKNNNNIWIQKLCGIMGKARSIIEIFIQMKKNFEEKIVKYEEIIFEINNNNNYNFKGMGANGNIVNMYKIFVNSMKDFGLKISKFEQEEKLFKKNQEELEKKISSLQFELNLHLEKEKKYEKEMLEIKEFKAKILSNEENQNIQQGQTTPQTQGQTNIKLYFNKMINNLLTAENVINYKDCLIKKLEGDLSNLNNKLVEAEKNILKESQGEGNKTSIIIKQNKKLIEVNFNLTKTINDLTEEKSQLLKTLSNKTVENIGINKDINSILKFYENKTLENNQINQSNQDISASVATSNSQQLLNKSKEFSQLFILMRKATNLFSSFDKRVKIFTDKINIEK